MSQSRKRRICPAAQREITPQECGEHRNSKYQCPANCIFNPFAPASYSQLLEMEGRLDQAAFKALVSEPFHGAEVQRRFAKLGYDHHGFSNAVLWELFHRKDEAGLPFARRWEKAGLLELKNDLRCLLHAKAGMYLPLMEVQRVIDVDSLECRDLFNPSRPPFIVFDRSAAKRACRYDVLLGQCYDLPHFTRFFGTAIPIPFMGTMEPEEVVREIVGHLGGPVETPSLQHWLLEHLNQFAEALWATGAARNKAAVARADFKAGKAIYRLAAPYQECRAVLDSLAEVAPERLTQEQTDEGFSDARVWFTPEAEVKLRHNVGREALGTVVLGQAFWRLEAITQARMDRFRELFESVMGARMIFEGMRMDDLSQVVAAKNTAPSSLVPPALLKDVPQLSLSASRISPAESLTHGEALEDRLFRSADQVFLEDSIPALNGATPRAAAQDHLQIGKLRRLLKQRINGADQRNLQNGGRYDAAWLAAELGHQDLCAPPPPSRPKPDAGTFCAAPEQVESAEEMPLAPPLPLHLDQDTAAQRINAAFEAFPDSLDLQVEAFDAGCTWLEDVDEILGDKLSDKEFEAMAAALIDAWFAMVPLGYRGPEVSFKNVTERLAEYSRRLEEKGSSENLLDHLKSEFQIHIAGMGILTFLELCKHFKLLKPKSASKTLFVIAVITAFIDEMHLALGGPATQ